LVVQRIFAWLSWRRVAMRDERRADLHAAYRTLGCARI
jgi:hypothetical protein